MKAGAITADNLNVPPNTLMKDKIHAVKVPRKYNFLELDIPKPLRDYIEIIPSNHNENVTAQFFDFECINLVTISWEIKVNINYDYFDMLPGLNNDPYMKVSSSDTTMIHDYTLKIPSIKFGIPYSSTYPIPEYRNKVFYTIGRASDIKISYNIHEEFSLDDIKIISPEEVEKLRLASTNQENYNEELLNIWNNGIANKSSYLTGEIKANVLEPENEYKRIWIYLNKTFPELPYEVYGEPDHTKIYILVKVSAPQVTYGSRLNVKWGYGEYNDSRKIRKTNTGLASYINAYGPWIKMDIENTLLRYNKTISDFMIADNQTHFGSVGYMKLKITAINSGSKDAFQTSYKFVFSKYAKILDNFGDVLNKKAIIKIVKDNASGETSLYINSNRQIPQNTKDAYNIYLKYDFGENANQQIINKRNLDENNEKVILKNADVTLCQNTQCNDDDSFVNQFIGLNFKMSMSKIIDIGPQDMLPEPEPEEPDQEDESEPESKFKAWIIGPIIACLVILAAIIYLFIDYKKKLFIFKKKENDSMIKPETNNKMEIKDIDKMSVKDTENTEKINVRRKRSVKNVAPSYFCLENKISVNN